MRFAFVTTFVSISVLAAAQGNAPTGKDWPIYSPGAQAAIEGLIGGSGTGSAGTGQILFHGGPVMGTVAGSGGTSPINIYYIWYGNWSSLDPTAQTILNTLANGIGGSPYFNISTTYYDSLNNHVLNAVSFPKFVTDNYSQGTSLKDTGPTGSVAAVVRGHIGVDLPLDANGIYFVLTTPDVNETSGFCTSYCGWHSYLTLNNVNVKYAYIGDPLRCPGACEFQNIGPNGNGGGDGMASIIAHELEEATTDPQLNAWFFASGNENADQCAWTFGSMSTASNGAKYNMTLEAEQIGRAHV